MAKPDLRGDLQQLLTGGGLRRLSLDAEGRRGAPEERGIPNRVGRRQQHQSLRRLRQCGYALSEVILDLARQGSRAGQLEPAGELSDAPTPRQLHQRQRIAAGLGDQPVADTIIESARDDRRQQGARIVILKPPERQLRQICQFAFVARLPNRQHDRDRFRQQPPGDEPENLRRGGVEPLRVVDEAQQRPLAGNLGEQGQRSQGDQKAVGGIAG